MSFAAGTSLQGLEFREAPPACDFQLDAAQQAKSRIETGRGKSGLVVWGSRGHPQHSQHCPWTGNHGRQRLVRCSVFFGIRGLLDGCKLVLFAMPRSLLAMCLLHCHESHVHLAEVLVTTHDQLSVSQGPMSDNVLPCACALFYEAVAGACTLAAPCLQH